MPKVLLVDPEPDSRTAFERALKGAGYEVSAAASGSFALTQLEWDRPHVIVTQARVDDMDGCELFGIVRSDPKTGTFRFSSWLGSSGTSPGRRRRPAWTGSAPDT